MLKANFCIYINIDPKLFKQKCDEKQMIYSITNRKKYLEKLCLKLIFLLVLLDSVYCT